MAQKVDTVSGDSQFSVHRAVSAGTAGALLSHDRLVHEPRNRGEYCCAPGVPTTDSRGGHRCGRGCIASPPTSV